MKRHRCIKCHQRLAWPAQQLKEFALCGACKAKGYYLSMVESRPSLGHGSLTVPCAVLKTRFELEHVRESGDEDGAA